MRRHLFAWLLLLCCAFPTQAGEARPRILLTNDDGIAAPGLAAMYAELVRLGEVSVAAPADNQSGVGHGITTLEPIMVRTIEPLVRVEGPQGPWYRIAARPASCVRLALSSLLGARPDLVVSGINRGHNAGLSVYVSGTVGAAREAAFDGIPSIAVSLALSPKMGYGPGAVFAGRLAAEVLKRGLPAGIFLSVNVPAGEIKGVKVVPHSIEAGVTAFDRRESPRREVYFWNIWTEPVDPADTDVGAIAQGFVTVTPLRIEANDPAALEVLKGWGLR